MNTTSKSRNSANELNKQIEKHLEELFQDTDKARASSEMVRYFDFCAKFHNYSYGNVWLILLAKPDASLVAGFHKWKSMGRWVKKGERGIPILVPMLIKEELEDGRETKHLVGFKVVYVFDIAQTEGEPLPEGPDWKSPEKNNDLNQRLIQFAESRGISVAFKQLPGEIQGLSRGGSIEIDLTAGTKTLVHEIAHELMHQKQFNLQSKAIKELEAESVAYVVCKHFGFGSLNSPNYLAFFEVSADEMLAHIERIRNAANEIITNIHTDSDRFCCTQES